MIWILDTLSNRPAGEKVELALSLGLKLSEDYKHKVAHKQKREALKNRPQNGGNPQRNADVSHVI